MRKPVPPSKAVILREDSATVLPLADEAAVQEALTHSVPTNTVRAYKNDWKDFTRYCAEREVSPLPAMPKTVAAYISVLAQSRKMSTVARRLSAIAFYHKWKGFEPPTRDFGVLKVLHGLERKYGVRPERKAAATSDVIKQLVQVYSGERLIDLRNRALILVGFAGAFRRSTLCAIEARDITDGGTHIDVIIRREKQDQRGVGRVVGIKRTGTEYCPVGALEAWMRGAGITSGPIFRGVSKSGAVRPGRLASEMVARVVQFAAKALGLDWKRFAGHSLRSGHVTEARRRRASVDEIMRVTGHASADMVLRYVREVDTVRGTSADKLGLDDGV